MGTARRRLGATAVAVSIVAHAVVLTALALHAPRLFVPHEPAGPPEPIIPVIIMPRTPPPALGTGSKPQPIRLHRRQLRREMGPPPIPPLIVPPASEAPAAARPAPAQPRASVQPTPAAQLSAALKRSAVGCANTSLLSAAERERCLEQLGRNARLARELPPAPSAGGRDSLAAAVAAKEAGERYRRGNVPGGLENPVASSGEGWRMRNPER